MTTYSAALVAALSARGVDVDECPTGGGCSALATGDYRFLITDGDARIPSGESVDETIALVCDYGPDGESGEEIASFAVCLISSPVLQLVATTDGETSRESRALELDHVDVVADALAEWIVSRS